MTDFEIKLISDKELTKVKAKPLSERVEEGIEYSRWMWHPTCPFCGLKDGGESASERPTETHMLNCLKRPLTPVAKARTFMGYKDGKAVYDNAEVEGGFVGQAYQSQLRYPVRQIIKLPKRDMKTKRIIPGEFIFVCKYYWKVEMVVVWLWSAKGKWVPWYEGKRERPKTVAVEPSESEANWLRMFVRKT